MDSKTYSARADRTVSDAHDSGMVVKAGRDLKLLHASLGMETESGEVADIMKRHLFYGTDIDPIHVKEEIGDLLWYVSLALDAIDSSFDEVMEMNIRKLEIRYPEKFTPEDAVSRDTAAEKAALSSSE